MESITQQEFPDLRRSPMMGYNNETPGLIRVFGETEDSCERQLKNVVEDRRSKRRTPVYLTLKLRSRSVGAK